MEVVVKVEMIVMVVLVEEKVAPLPANTGQLKER